MTNNTQLCKCGKVGEISCPHDERCGNTQPQLPAEVAPENKLKLLPSDTQKEIRAFAENTVRLLPSASAHDYGFYTGALSGITVGAAEYATKLHQAQLSIKERGIVITTLNNALTNLEAAGNKLARKARSLRLSVTAHPHYTGEPNAEWTDLVEGIDEALAEWKGEKEPAPMPAGDHWKAYITQFDRLNEFWSNLPEATALWLAQQIDIFAQVYPAPAAKGAVWVKDALEWAKEAIAFADKELECPKHLVETWGNMLMNALHAIGEAQNESVGQKEVKQPAIKLEPGLKFRNIHMAGFTFYVRDFVPADNVLSVLIVEDQNNDNQRIERGWNLQHTLWAFEKGEYILEKEVKP